MVGWTISMQVDIYVFSNIVFGVCIELGGGLGGGGGICIPWVVRLSAQFPNLISTW